ncbi:MAG: MBL fold metallo-hydrolase [Phycisphaerales bacterium]
MTTSPTESVASPHLQIFALGDFQTNCMIVTRGQPRSGQPCMVVDCGYEPQPLLDAIEEQGLKPQRVVLTHAHADHIAGLNDLYARFGEVPIWIHKSEEQWLQEPMLNLSAALGLSITAPTPAGFLADGDSVEFESIEFSVLHTPGHSPGGITLVHAPSKTALVGDTLFAGSIGRTDFPGSSFKTLAASIKNKLYTLDPETVCYPGHGPATTIGREIKSNPFVKA